MAAITVNSLWPNLAPNAVSKPIWNRTERIDQYQDMTWRAAGNLFLDLGIMAPGEPRSSGYHTPSAHILTPEGDRATHYFWAFARDFAMGDEKVSAGIAATVQTAFLTEDKPMIEAAQRNIDHAGASLRNFTVGDAGSASVRRGARSIGGPGKAAIVRSRKIRCDSFHTNVPKVLDSQSRDQTDRIAASQALTANIPVACGLSSTEVPRNC